MNKIFKLAQINNNWGFFFVVVLFTFFTSSSVFAQNAKLEVSTEQVLIKDNVVIEDPVKESSSSVINSNVNFILWFMGTKEDMGRTLPNDGYSKKSFMTSGREPNHLLVKTLLKKALNIKSC